MSVFTDVLVLEYKFISKLYDDWKENQNVHLKWVLLVKTALQVLENLLEKLDECMVSHFEAFGS